jgi:hypothetical protein
MMKVSIVIEPTSIAQHHPTMSRPAGSAQLLLSAIASGVSLVIISGFFLSVAGMPLSRAFGASLLVGTLGGFLLGRRARPAALPLLALLLAAGVGMLVPNDTYNNDIVWQLSFADEARYFDTLLLPGFIGSTYSTKYDGWIFVVAGVARVLRVDPFLLARWGNILLFPALTGIALTASRHLELRDRHAIALLACAVLFGGDGIRLISFAGPRSLATLLQIAGILALVRALKAPWPTAVRPAVTAAAALVASGITHNFFGLANTLLVASSGLAVLIVRAYRTTALRSYALFVSVYAVGVLPFLWIKRSVIPQGAAASIAGGTGATTVDIGSFIGTRWSEYGTLWPYWILAALILYMMVRGRTWSCISSPVLVFLTAATFVVPLIVLLIPSTRFVITDVATTSRLVRLVPLAPAAMAWTAYAWYLLLGTRTTPERRRAVIVCAAVALLTLTWPAYDTARWYRHVWPAARGLENAERDHYGVAVFLGPKTTAGCTVLSSSAADARTLAGILRGYRIFFYDSDGTLQSASVDGTRPFGRRSATFDYIVSDRPPARSPSTLAYRSGQLSVFQIGTTPKCGGTLSGETN